MDAFIVVDVVKRCARVSHHKCVGGENRGRNGRGPVNREERANSGELVADFFFLNVEEVGDVFDHLFMGESQFIASGAVRRRGSDDVGGIVHAVHG